MDKFKVSPATIHRDIVEMSKSKSVMRVSGGVIYVGDSDTRGTAPSFRQRTVANKAAKESIAAKILAMINEDDIIFLDSSTTVLEIAVLLASASFQHLTIITNSIPVMALFERMPDNWALVGLGGNFDPQLNSMIGASTLEELSRLYITKAFVSAFGLDETSATTNHERQAELLRTVLARSDKAILAVDSAKMGRRGLYRIASRSDFATIVSE